MPSSYTTNLVIEKPATGEQAGIWGTTANQSYDFIDMGIDGNASVGLSASSYDLRTDERASSVGRNKVIVFTGTLSNEGNVTISPNTAKKIYYVINHTDGGFGLTFKQGTGPTFRLLNGRSAIIYADGALGGAGSVAGVLNDFQVNSLLVQTNLVIGAGGNIQWSGPATFNQPATFSGLATFNAGAMFALGPVTINLTGDAPNDLYYRSGTGSLARLGIGAAGTVLTATAGGLSWATPSGASINMPVASSAANQVLFVNTSFQMVQNANLRFIPGTGLGLGMVPTRALSVGGGLGSSAVIQIDAPDPAAPIARTLLFTTANAPRWQWAVTGEAEGGSGAPGGGVAGGNLALQSWNDAQTVGNLNNFIAYRTGRMTIGNVYANFDSQLAVRNTTSSSFIEIWQNAAGATVASLDSNGNFLAHNFSGSSGGGGLALDANMRLNINGSVTGAPLGTLHLGPDNLGSRPNPTIVLQGATQQGNGLTGNNAVAIYCKANSGAAKIVFQFSVNSVPYYAYMDLVSDTNDGVHVWHITQNPV